jgi:Holliday junction DNA helicase RuvA
VITRLTGVVNRVLDEEARLQVGPVEYQVLVPEFVRRQLQSHVGTEITLATTQYLEGNMNGGRFVPRIIGFASDVELEFFELFCTVEKIGVRKALKALNQPIKSIADAISRQDAKWLTSLPGIGPASAEQIVTTLKRKVTRFALMSGPGPAEANGQGSAPVTSDVIEDAYRALMSVGHSAVEARTKLESVLGPGKTYKTVEDVLLAVYSKP